MHELKKQQVAFCFRCLFAWFSHTPPVCTSQTKVRCRQPQKTVHPRTCKYNCTPGLSTGDNPTPGPGQEAFRISRVESARIQRLFEISWGFGVGSSEAGFKSRGMGRVTLGRPDPRGTREKPCSAHASSCSRLAP